MKIRSLGLLLSLAIGFSVLPFSTPARAALYLTNLKFHLDPSNSSSYSGSGPTWNDLSGLGNSFALSATQPSFINTAPKNFQLTKSNSGGTFFSGSNSWLGGQDFTVSAWIKTTNVGSGTSHWTQMHVMSAESGGLANDWGFGVDGNGKISFGTGGGSDLTYASSTSVNTGNWVMVTATRTNSTGAIRIYVNGSLETNSGSNGNANSTLTSNATLKIGAGDDGGATFGGNIGAVYGYNAVLTDAQVLENYNSTMQTYGYSPPTPANSAVPTISGTTTFGQVLTTTNGTWSNSPTSYQYQWSRASSSGGTYADITGETSTTYTLTAADVGKYLKATVTAIKPGVSASATSAATAQIASGSASAFLTLEPGNFIYRQAKSISATATVAGKVTFRVAGKILPGCKNKSVVSSNSYTATCTYRPSNHSIVTISATLVPADSYYSASVTSTAQYLVTRRTGTR
jgi:hypothetical protein